MASVLPLPSGHPDGDDPGVGALVSVLGQGSGYYRLSVCGIDDMRFEQQFMTHDGRGPHENDPEWPTEALSLLEGVDPIAESRGL